MLARYETAVEDTLWMQGMQRRIPLWAEHTLTSQSYLWSLISISKDLLTKQSVNECTIANQVSS